MTIIVVLKFKNDPRPYRVVTRAGLVIQLEVCSRDSLGQESWRPCTGGTDHPVIQDVLARALHEIHNSNRPRVESVNGVTTIDLGTGRP